MAKKGIHPTYYHDATITCACGHVFITGGTVQHIKTDICSQCHPFYTGEQRIVDTAGQVERFMKRLQAAQTLRPAKKKPKKSRQQLIETTEE